MATETLAYAPQSGSVAALAVDHSPFPHDQLNDVPTARRAQVEWESLSVAGRLIILRRARHALAGKGSEITAAVSPELARSHADTLVAELLPLLAAIRYLEREAGKVLHSRSLGQSGLPFWLMGIRSEIHRVPFGRVLIIAPANYPLFLAGVQVFQALCAGNAVVWKPAPGSASIAHLVARTLVESGLPEALLEITDDTVHGAEVALASLPDKVFFTGSGRTGRLLLERCAQTATPCVMELSGNDACIVLPSADLNRVVKALSFGMRLNGSATCMAPRRVLLVDADADRRNLLVELLSAALAKVPPVTLPPKVRHELDRLLADAQDRGATIVGDPLREPLRPLLVLNGTPEMKIAQADLFAPVLTLICVTGTDGVLDAQEACPLALTTSIFGEERSAQALARRLICGTITINDLIVPTADPRTPFGARRQSGFGVTRGAEGLLEMTAVKVISTRRGSGTRQYEPTGEPHARLFQSLITAAHAGTFAGRWTGITRAISAAMEFKQK